MRETVAIVSGEGTLRVEAALSARDWRGWSDMKRLVCGVKKEIERRYWRKGLYLYAREEGTRRGHVT